MLVKIDSEFNGAVIGDGFKDRYGFRSSEGFKLYSLLWCRIPCPLLKPPPVFARHSMNILQFHVRLHQSPGPKRLKWMVLEELFPHTILQICDLLRFGSMPCTMLSSRLFLLCRPVFRVEQSSSWRCPCRRWYGRVLHDGVEPCWWLLDETGPEEARDCDVHLACEPSRHYGIGGSESACVGYKRAVGSGKRLRVRARSKFRIQTASLISVRALPVQTPNYASSPQSTMSDQPKKQEKGEHTVYNELRHDNSSILTFRLHSGGGRCSSRGHKPRKGTRQLSSRGVIEDLQNSPVREVARGLRQTPSLGEADSKCSFQLLLLSWSLSSYPP